MIYREKQYNDTLCHFNPNHDPKNGQFSKAGIGSVLSKAVNASGVGTVGQLARNKVVGTVDAATRIPERVNHVKKAVALGATGAALGASVAAGLLAGPVGLLPISALGKSVAMGFASIMGGMQGSIIGITAATASKELKDYMSGNTADNKDIARYLRSNTRY